MTRVTRRSSGASWDINRGLAAKHRMHPALWLAQASATAVRHPPPPTPDLLLGRLPSWCWSTLLCGLLSYGFTSTNVPDKFVSGAARHTLWVGGDAESGPGSRQALGSLGLACARRWPLPLGAGAQPGRGRHGSTKICPASQLAHCVGPRDVSAPELFLHCCHVVRTPFIGALGLCAAASR